ncbi:MAG: phosphopantothenate/pantothenate synthetase, partial [Thermoplasmata archaeon]|nr:phosphopantothenate/pantothenate synthetase [Thermoplasmata archaeon]
MDIPPSHPRYKSLKTRHTLVEAYEQGILATAGLIAHGRGEAFDYILGEKTTPPALEAEKAAAAYLATASHPVLSVNGNTAVLCAPQIVRLSDLSGALVEVNLFYRTAERMGKVARLLEESGAERVLGLEPDCHIPGLDHARGLCSSEGIGKADVVFVPLEDGDRCQALRRMGKTVIVVDLNPLSRTSLSATVSIVDEVSRALDNIIEFMDKMDREEALGIIREYD